MTSKVGLNVNWVTSTNYKRIDFYSSKHTFNAESMRLPRVELGSIAWKAIILTVGLQTLFDNEETRRTSIEKIQVGRNYS